MITQKLLHELFDYDQETGYLIWKNTTSKRIKNGDIAGSMLKSGYLNIGILGKRYYIHRIIWCFHNGELPKTEIDHINGIKNDNRIENLRLATRAENTRNTSLRSDNTSGIKGVTWDFSHKKWLASIKINKKRYNLGRFSNISEAEKAVREARELLHGEFTNHGSKI